MNKKVIIIGASGHGKVIADIVIKSGDKIIGFLDDSLEGTVAGNKILGKTDDFSKYSDCEFIIAIGNNIIRQKISEKLSGVKWYTAIHPKAVISVISPEIGEGSVICAGSVIGPSVSIGVHTIINNCANIDHDCTIGSFTHISPNAAVCGTCSVGDFCHIGAGVAIKNNINICNRCIVGVGAAVVKNIEESGVYMGVPAVRKNENLNIHKL